MLLWLIEKTMPIMLAVTDKLFRLPVTGKLFRFVLQIATYLDHDCLPSEQVSAEQWVILRSEAPIPEAD
jgi:hypothetical protein